MAVLVTPKTGYGLDIEISEGQKMKCLFGNQRREKPSVNGG